MSEVEIGNLFFSKEELISVGKIPTVVSYVGDTRAKEIKKTLAKLEKLFLSDEELIAVESFLQN
ncbi:MAG: hypothetical protein HQP61_06485 [Peptococcaceae bacterium]|nr:hypothetical protein [Candidatus Syntrophopropionicum ammoniitolerans]